MSTRDTFYGTTGESWLREDAYSDARKANSIDYAYPELMKPRVFSNNINLDQACTVQQLEWCYDGSGIVTTSDDYGMRLYLKGEEEELMIPFWRHFKPTSILCSRIHPEYSLYGENTLVLSATKDMPIALNNAFQEPSLSQYYLTTPSNDTLMDAHCIEFIADSRFIAGAKSTVAVFDLTDKHPVNIVKTKGSIVSSVLQEDKFTIVTGSYSNDINVIDTRERKTVSHTKLPGSGTYQILRSGTQYIIIQRQSNFLYTLDERMNVFDTIDIPFTIQNQKSKACMDGNILYIGSPQGLLRYTGKWETMLDIPFINNVTRHGDMFALSYGHRENQFNGVCINKDL